MIHILKNKASRLLVVSDHEVFAIAWFEETLDYAKHNIEQLYKQYKLSEILKTIYSLIWDDFCSSYLEWIKPKNDAGVHCETLEKTIYFFEELLHLLHPFMPFITEELYHLVRGRGVEDDLVIKQVVLRQRESYNFIAQGTLLNQLLSAIRDFRTKNNFSSKQAIDVVIEKKHFNKINAIQNVLVQQANIANLEFGEPLNNGLSLMVEDIQIFIVNETMALTTISKQDLLKDLEHLESFLNSIDKKLNNEKFVKNAAPQVLELEKKKKADTKEKIALLQKMLNQH